MAATPKDGEKKARKLLANGLDQSIGKATQIKPGEVRNPNGLPKGYKHLSTHIQELLNDEEFEAWVPDRLDGFKRWKGAPIKAIVHAFTIRAMAGDYKAFDLLAKYGYGAKVDLSDLDQSAVAIMPVVRIIDERQPTRHLDSE